MRNFALLTGIALLTTGGLAKTATAQDVLNGGFETPEVTASQGWDIFDDGAPGVEWDVQWSSSVTDGNAPAVAKIELHEGVNNWASHDGDQHTELDSDWDGPGGSINNEQASVIISQDVATCDGASFTATYYYSGRPGHADNKMEVNFGSSTTAYDVDASTNDNTEWIMGTLGTTADSNSTTLSFEETGTPDSLGMFLDSVSVTGPICGEIDIKFCSNPNAFNSKRTTGGVPVTLFGTDSLDVNDINVTTVKLCEKENLSNCTVPNDDLKDYTIQDRGDPTTDIGAAQCAIIADEEQHFLNPDGFDDIDLVFEASAVCDVIGCDALNKGDDSPDLVVVGELNDTSPFFAGVDHLDIQK